MSLENVHIPIRDSRVLSIASINRKLEIAILSDEFFCDRLILWQSIRCSDAYL